jgi:hypothetical protein
LSGRSPIDVQHFLDDPRYSFELRTIETADERRARIRRENDEAAHRRQVFWAVFVVLLIVGAAAFAVMLFSSNADNKEWARNIVAAISSGLAGYVGGSAVKKSG